MSAHLQPGTLLKSPTTTYLVPAIIPLIPGSGLYYTMNYAVRGEWDEFSARGLLTLKLTLALAAGIIVITSLTAIVKVDLALSFKAEQLAGWQSLRHGLCLQRGGRCKNIFIHPYQRPSGERQVRPVPIGSPQEQLER